MFQNTENSEDNIISTNINQMQSKLELQDNVGCPFKQCTENMQVENYAGLRLRNPNVYCFINCAINSLVTNSTIRLELYKIRPFHNWYKFVLQYHCNMPILTIDVMTEDELSNDINNFFNGTQCMADHTIDCFKDIRYSYFTRQKMVSVITEIKNLLAKTNLKKDVYNLKYKLRAAYPSISSYHNVEQDDSRQPFLTLLMHYQN